MRSSSCLRRAATGHRSEIVSYGRFLANEKVTVEALLTGWGEQTAVVAAGRHVLAIQDTSEIHFRTTAERRRGLGEIGKGIGAACCCMRCWRWMRITLPVWAW